MGLPSPSELTGGVHKCEVKVASLSFKTPVIIQIIIVGYICAVICF